MLTQINTMLKGITVNGKTVKYTLKKVPGKENEYEIQLDKSMSIIGAPNINVELEMP